MQPKTELVSKIRRHKRSSTALSVFALSTPFILSSNHKMFLHYFYHYFQHDLRCGDPVSLERGKQLHSLEDAVQSPEGCHLSGMAKPSFNLGFMTFPP